MTARVLIIEDNPANMELMTFLLNAYGHSPLSAYDGEEGAECARRQLPDLILCDVHLPKLDGYGVLRLLKCHQALRSIPVLAVTALAMVGDREKLLSAGFDGYIAKPIEPETFVDQIETYLSPHLRSHAIAVAMQPSPAPPASPTATPPVPHRSRILVVDDSAVNRDVLRSMLAPFGYELLFAASATQGFHRAQQAPVDLILCDLHMPENDGLNLLRSVKADPQLAGIPVILVTAALYTTNERETALDLGAAHFLHLPVDSQQLIEHIENCLRVPGEA